MSDVAIKIENVGKQYRLGLVTTGTLSHDLNRWWKTAILRQEDPYLKIGETNDRTTKGASDYVWALRDINMEIKKGDVVGIIGKNGAGKSTLLKLLSRVTTPTTGTIKAHGRIGSLLEVGTGFHPEMTGRENIYMNGAILGMSKQEITRKFDEIVDFSGCERYIDTPVKRYSSGMMVRLGFAVAAHLDPEILIVDEVLAVGDAEFQKKAIGKMQDVSKGEGRTVLFVSHNMASIKQLCNVGVVLHNGLLSFEGRVDNCVEYYLEKRFSNLISSYVFGENGNISESKRVGFVSAAIGNEDCIFKEGEDLVFYFQIKSNDTVKGCRINAGINSSMNATIGVVCGDVLFDLSRGELKKIKMYVKNNNLAIGKYSISFSVGLGNDKTTSMTEFDVLSEIFCFEIVPKGELAETKVWKSEWGHIQFSSLLEF